MKEIGALQAKYPLVNKLIATEEVFWINPNIEKYERAIKDSPLNEENVKDAEERLKRFAPYIAKVFPETKGTNGIIESPFSENIFYERSFRDKLQATYFRRIIIKM